MKILLIGGTGNISTPITQSLIECGEQVTLFNRGNHLVPGVRQIVGDRGDYPRFEQQMAEADTFDCVIDMVAYHPDDVRAEIDSAADDLLYEQGIEVFLKHSDHMEQELS